MSSENTAEFTHPGPILRAARDELRLSIEHVAERLHLRPSVVALIESETYDDFSSDVFLKGYFRSYCRLVGLHEERMVELLERQLEAIQKEDSKRKKAEAEAQASEKRMHLFKLGLVVTSILLVCAASIWLLVGSSGLGLETSKARHDQANDVMLSQSDDDGMAEADSSVAGQDGSAGALGEDPATRVGEPANLEDETLLTSSDDMIDMDEKASAAELVGEGDVENLESNATALELSEAKVQLSIVFTGECWFEVYDAGGQRISAGLKQDGTRFDYQGIKPVRVVLGNGNAASIEVDGQVLDISSKIRRSGRAEVVID